MPRGLVAVLGAALLAAGCTLGGGSGGTAAPVPGGTGTPTATGQGQTTPTPTTPSTPGPTGGAQPSGSGTPGFGATVLPPPPKASTGAYAVRTAVLSGRSGSVRWSVKVPEFSGPARAATVNAHIRASAEDAIDRAKREGRQDGGVRRTLGSSYTVSTNDGRTVQAALVFVDYLAGTAHPSDSVGTTAIDVTTGKPILLTDVFRSESAALKVIAPVVRTIAKRQGQPVTEPAGLRPVHANFANWQATGAGITFYFQDYQLGGHGLRMYTVGWNTLSPLITDDARRVLAPPRR